MQRRQKKNRKKKEQKATKQKTVTSMTDINPTISMITLNINGLNTLKKERLSTRNPVKI